MALTHQPKGGMCTSCVHVLRAACNELPFHIMPVIGRHGRIKIVRCTEYQRREGK